MARCCCGCALTQLVRQAGEGSALRSNAITAFPRELFFVLRVVQLLRGLAHGMGVASPDAAAAWAPLAQRALR
jgi:hypothetical protein